MREGSLQVTKTTVHVPQIIPVVYISKHQRAQERHVLATLCGTSQLHMQQSNRFTQRAP
jgi:hypothetical protein